MLLLEKQQARWKSGSNEGPAREAAQWGHGGGKINSIPPPSERSSLLQTRGRWWASVGLARWQGPAILSTITETLQHSVLTVQM